MVKTVSFILIECYRFLPASYQKIILPTIAATITALAVWLLLDYLMGGTVFLVENLLKAVAFALAFGITHGWWSHRMQSK